MDEEKKKECLRCKYFDCYYIKGDKRFNKIKLGWCCRKVETVNVHDTCESFKCRLLNKIDKGIINVNLYGLLREITTLRNIIEEQIVENEEL